MSTSKLKTLPVVATLAIALLGFGLANPGSAGAWLAQGPLYQSPPQGGTWQYGFWNARVWSNYHHPSVCHASTVELNGRQQSSLDTPAGRYSQASIGTLQHHGTDRYYYRTVDNVPSSCV